MSTSPGPDGATWTVPAFWAGDDRFKVRFAGPVEGRYQLRSRCSDPADAGAARPGRPS